MTPAPGARTADEPDEASAARQVQALFNTIAPTYDRLNHLLSFGLDRHWWRRTARTFSDVLARPEARILDICCGTGDMTAALLTERAKALRCHPEQREGSAFSQDPQKSVISTEAHRGPRRAFSARWGGKRSGETCISSTAHRDSPQPITGLDFSPEMLARARTKYPSPAVHWVEGDAMHLDFADNSFDLITAAFGFRNLTNYAAGLQELHRVLAPGGRLGILECNQPDGLRRIGYNLYLHHGLPTIGGWISGEREAYRYLPASIARFPRPAQMLPMLDAAGFAQPHWQGFFLHAAGLYTATKP